MTLADAQSLEKNGRPPTAGPLRVHPGNPRYFADRTGEVVYLTGSHTWATIQEAGPTDPPERFDWNAWLDLLSNRGHTFTRLWTWEHPKWGSWWPSDYFIEPMPWLRTGPDLARDGRPRFDVSQFDPAFFERLATRVADCRDRGLYVSVMLFQGWSSCNKPFRPQGPNPWHSHPFNRDNNVNGIDGSSPDGEGRDWVHTLRNPSVTELLEHYVRKVVDTVNGFDNVIYEIANELDGTAENTAWQYHMINVIHEYEREEKPDRHPVLMTGQWPLRDNAALFASPAEAVSPTGWWEEGDESWEADPPVLAEKVVLVDPDHIWGVGGSVDWIWKVFTRGHCPLYMDPWGYGHMEPRYDSEGDDAVRKAMGQTARLAALVDLAAAVPRPGLASTRFALAARGREYVVYQPASGRFGVDLSGADGPFELTWWDLVEGSTVGEPVPGGGPAQLTPPGRGPAVAHLRRTGS
jgi:Family of unknown function (DUF6298)